VDSVGTLHINSELRTHYSVHERNGGMGKWLAHKGLQCQGKAIETNRLCLACGSLYDANIWLF